MKKLISFFLLSFTVFANAQIVTLPIPGAPGLNVTIGTGANALPLQNIYTNPNATNITMGDDEWRNVALPYSFPYFGQTFNNSWMLSNGAVTFQDPSLNAGGMCCSGMNLSTLSDTRYNYTIFGIWTDLIATNPNSHYYLHQNNSTTYGWYGVNQYGTNNLNSFEIKIDSTGLVDTRIGGALVTGNFVTSGMTGDLTQGQYFQYYHGEGINIPYGAGVSWQALSGTGVNACVVNPLYSPSCPGYQAAYLTQQCSENPLYSPSCPLYETIMASLNPPKTENTSQTISDPVVNETLATNTVTAEPSPTAIVSLTPTQQTSQQVIQNVNTQTSTETKSQTTKTETASSGTKNTTTNTRQSVAATQQAKEQVNNASTMEQQVAAQASLIGAMSFVPGFDAYQSAKIIDVNAIALQRQYGKDVVDNRRLGRGLFGPSDSVHQEMVNQQYK